jgi:hypothetical protein
MRNNRIPSRVYKTKMLNNKPMATGEMEDKVKRICTKESGVIVGKKGTLIGGMRNVCKVLVRKPKEKRKLRRLRYRWEDNIRMDLREIMWEVWIHLVEDR